MTAAMLHDRVGYTPYEGRTLKGWPEVVLSRGRVVVEGNALHVAAGSGEFIARGTPERCLRTPARLASARSRAARADGPGRAAMTCRATTADAPAPRRWRSTA